MDLRFFHKTKSPTYVELFADRGHPGPKIFAANTVMRPTKSFSREK